jgi:hypothetical protein
MRAYRIRVYGKPRKNIDAHQFVQAVLMLARELRDQHLHEQAAANSTGPDSDEAVPGDK